MVILTLEQLEPYKSLRILGAESMPSVSRRTVYKLQYFEQQELLKERIEYGVPYLLAFKLHVEGKSTSQIAQELGISNSTDISRTLKYHKIPTLNRREVAMRHGYPKGPNGNNVTVSSEGSKDTTTYTITSLAIGSMMQKACPRCHGDLFFLDDIYGQYFDCIQCGHNINPDTKHSNRVAVS